MEKEAAETIRRWVVLQRYSMGLSNDAEKIIDAMFADLENSLSSKKFGAVVDKILSSSQAELEGLFQVAFKEGVGAYVTAEAVAFGLRPIPVTAKMVKEALTKPLAGQNISTEEIFDDMLRSVKLKSRNIVQRGINEGRTIAQLRVDMQDVSNATKNAASAYARTATNAVANESRKEMFAENSDIIDRYMWLSALDHRTSDICITLDRKVFKVNNGPHPPAHVNCRSSTVPIKKGEKISSIVSSYSPRPAVEPSAKFKKGDTVTRTGKVRKPRKGGPLKGTTSTARTYETWIKQQPAAYQRDVLGNKAYEAMKAGAPLTTILKSRSSAINLIGLEKALN